MINFLACFFICASCLAQQYPFVHYTPKDGLINSRVKKAYQDSKGRMYFLTYGGLSVYDGARFKNYTTQTGLAANLINDIIEVGDDSLLIATNSGHHLNVLVQGKIELFKTDQSIIPVVNQFYKHDDGNIYLSTDNGLYELEKDHFRKLNTSLTPGKNSELLNMANITGIGNWLVLSINEMESRDGFYLYDIMKNRICDSISQRAFLLGKDDRNRIWITSSFKLYILDPEALAKGKLSLVPPPGSYQMIKDYSITNMAFKDEVWLVYRDSIPRNVEVHRISESGSVFIIPLPSQAVKSALRHFYIDRENTIWLSNDGEGVFKIVNSPLQIFHDLFARSLPGNADHVFYFNDTTWYSTSINKLFCKTQNGLEEFNCNMKYAPEIFYNDGKILFGSDHRNIYEGEINRKNRSVYFRPVISLPDTDFLGNRLLVDPFRNIITIQATGLGVWENNKLAFHLPVSFPDILEVIALDKNNLLWIISRYSEIRAFSIHPENPSQYLREVYRFSKEQFRGSPRSFVFDKNGLLWIGTRDDGLVGYRQEGDRLKQLYHFHTGNGLTDNFIYTLACDSLNNIIVGTQTGLDRVLRVDENSFRIENLSKSNNYFARISQCWADAEQAYARSYTGTILQVSKPSTGKPDYRPQLLLEEIKVNAQPIALKNSFRHKENNISFAVAAPSFIDEKQVAYSYLLEGSGNKQWSDTTPANSLINLTNLSAGNYVLKMKAFFFSTSYAPSELSYSFKITPAWWQTSWFRSGISLLGIGLLLTAMRFYYKRRLEKQLDLLEKQQAIEKERTRIATDMHDDLGAGLSRIKFLSQSLSSKEINNESVKTDLEKITGYSDEMTEKMGEIVWALNEKNDSLADLVAYTRSYAVEYLSSHNIQCKADTPMHLPGTFIPGEIRRNIFLTVKECLHNIVKHANASQVFFSVELNGAIHIIIHDNGKGIDWNNQRTFSNGIQNIKKRMSEIDGKVEFLNDQGTKVKLEIPLAL